MTTYPLPATASSLCPQTAEGIDLTGKAENPDTEIPPSAFAETNSVTAQQENLREWFASLDLKIDRYAGKSRLIHNRHQGPLRLLRPYYPEGQERIHLYLIHPPGGLVCGDRLQINIELDALTKTLITTPSAGKVYRSDRLNHPQTQNLIIHCGKDAQIEWLPQENIIYSGANGFQNLTLETQTSSRFILWEITALGRPATSTPFESGSYTQRLQINLEGMPRLIERVQLTGNSLMQKARWGLGQQPVYGSMLAGYFTGDKCQHLLHALRAEATILQAARQDDRLQWAATRKDNILIIRALAQQSEPIKELFHRIWDFTRPSLMQRPSHYPRIWST